MKKLFGVIALACLPVACGSTLPSGPDVSAAPDVSNDASVSSLRRAVPTPPACDSNLPDAIQLSVTSDDTHVVTIEATPVLNGDRPTPPCFAPAWSLESAQGDASLKVSIDGLSATLAGPAGTYEVVASVGSARALGRVTGTIKVILH